MSNPNAYAIRLELLKMAQQSLEAEYFQKVDIIRTDWNNRVNANAGALNPEAAPKLPEIYTMDEIVAKAKILNDFVSQG